MSRSDEALRILREEDNVRTRWSTLAVVFGCLIGRPASAQFLEVGAGVGTLSMSPCDLWSGLSGHGVVLQGTIHPERRFSPEFLVTYSRGTASVDPQRYAYAASFSGGDVTRTEIAYALVIRQRLEPSGTHRTFGFLKYGVLGWTVHERITAISVVIPPPNPCRDGGCICLSCATTPTVSTTPARSLYETVGPATVLVGAGVQTNLVAHTALRFESELAMFPLPPPVFGLRASITAVVRIGR
jgi:hypothetical protein